MKGLRDSAVALSLSFVLCACGPVMEANRPDPVDLTQFKPGQRRIEVVKLIGVPLATIPDGPKSCDLYKLYTHGPDSGGKAAAAFGEAVADVFTLGLAEVIWTPLEAATKNSVYTVTFCYDKEDALLTVEEQRSTTPAAPPASEAQQAPTSATAGAAAGVR